MKNDKMKSLGFIGLGSFGKFFIPYLKPYFDITVYDQRELENQTKSMGVKWGNLQMVCQNDVVVAGVPIHFMENLLKEIAPIINPNCLFMDICSVKVKPVEWMTQYLPSTVEIIATHPLFGPQSGKNGIKGLNIVICPINASKQNVESIHQLFGECLGLNVLERTPVIHDKQMAYVQALTHFVGRAVNEMDIPDVEQKTPAYQYLLDIKRNLGQDSWDLFLTIENGNPFAKEVREQFMDELKKLHLLLD